MTETATHILPSYRADAYTEQEIDFVRAYVDIGDLEEACKAASIKLSDGKNILLRRATAQMIREEAGVKLAKMVPKALARLDEGSIKGATPDRGQLDAVKTILDRAGLIAPKASEATNHNPEMQDMSEHELRTIATQALGEIAIRGVPSAPPIEGQVIDMLE